MLTVLFCLLSCVDAVSVSVPKWTDNSYSGQNVVVGSSVNGGLNALIPFVAPAPGSVSDDEYWTSSSGTIKQSGGEGKGSTSKQGNMKKVEWEDARTKFVKESGTGGAGHPGRSWFSTNATGEVPKAKETAWHFRNATASHASVWDKYVVDTGLSHYSNSLNISGEKYGKKIKMTDGGDDEGYVNLESEHEVTIPNDAGGTAPLKLEDYNGGLTNYSAVTAVHAQNWQGMGPGQVGDVDANALDSDFGKH